jgi:hypothetical protein
MESANKVVGRPYPKAWIIGKTLKQIEHGRRKTSATTGSNDSDILARR